jgi:nickel-dependent lactate racemase
MKKDFNVHTDVIYNKYAHHLMNYVNQPHLSDNEIENVIDDINFVLNIGLPVYINIYTNSEGTVFANDSKGNPITNREVVTIVYVHSYVINVNGFETNINSYTSYLFGDNSTFRVYDTDQTYYYYIEGVVPNNIKLLT